ncbi:ribonuclease H-like domain-containing protein [Tanacetum coccineum]
MVRSMWLYKHKFYADGTLSRYKACLVANGSSQQLGVDFDETFSPVVKPATIRTVLSLVVSRYATWAGFYHSRCESSLFIYRHGSQVAYLLLYVDDIILTASSIVLLQHLIDSLHREFDMTDLGVLNYFLGISTVRHSTVDTESKLGPDGVLICLYMHDPREPHLAALKRILRYVQGTLDLGLHLYESSTTSLVGYIDADWAGCPSTRSAEAEYRGVANVVTETACLCNLLRELHSPLSTTTLVFCDKVSAIYMSVNPVQHQRTKHIEIDIHFVRDMVTASQVRVLHVPSRFQYADIFTK